MKKKIIQFNALITAVAAAQGCAEKESNSNVDSINLNETQGESLSESEAELIKTLISNDVETIGSDGSFELDVESLGEVTEKAKTAGYSTELVGPTASISTFKVLIREDIPAASLKDKVNVDVDRVLREDDMEIRGALVHRS